MRATQRSWHISGRGCISTTTRPSRFNFLIVPYNRSRVGINTTFRVLLCRNPGCGCRSGRPTSLSIVLRVDLLVIARIRLLHHLCRHLRDQNVILGSRLLIWEPVWWGIGRSGVRILIITFIWWRRTCRWIRWIRPLGLPAEGSVHRGRIALSVAWRR